MAKAGCDAMAKDALTQDFDAHVLFTFAEIPASPPMANRVARVKRWFLIAFVESWLAIWLYRLKLRLRAAGVPALPGACDLLSRMLFRVQIGNRVEIGPGLMITHGNVVIDGRTKIGRNCQINPWVTIGLSNSKKLGFSIDGPTIGDDVHIGTGAKLLGPITVGDYARIGANAVVVHDVPANATVVGAPARVIGAPTSAGAAASSSADGSGRDGQLAAHMREAIVDYKLHRQSLKALVDTLLGSFEIGGDPLRALQDDCKDDLIFLDAVAATSGEESQQVAAAVDAIETALLRFA
jgi:serine O-acetyltransferase